jgi:hypothetical protein
MPIPLRQSITIGSYLARQKLATVLDVSRHHKAPPAGLEPATVGLEVRCSDPLSYGGRQARRPHRTA